MKLRGLLPHLLAIVAGIAPLSPQATPATREQVFCNGTNVVIGKVYHATNDFCQSITVNDSGEAIGCSPDDLVHLDVQITGIIGQKGSAPPPGADRNFEVGDMIRISSNASANPDITGKYYRDNMAVLGSHGNLILRLEKIHDAFMNKEFIFSFSVVDNVNYRRRFWANVWPTSEKSWALDTMVKANGRSCPRPL